MEHIGHIEASPAAPSLTRDAWLAFIRTRGDLLPCPSRMGRNPANGEPIELRPPPDAVRLVRDDGDVASFSWGPEEYAVVNVTAAEGHREDVAAVAREFARTLGGIFTEYNDPS